MSNDLVLVAHCNNALSEVKKSKCGRCMEKINEDKYRVIYVDSFDETRLDEIVKLIHKFIPFVTEESAVQKLSGLHGTAFRILLYESWFAPQYKEYFTDFDKREEFSKLCAKEFKAAGAKRVEVTLYEIMFNNATHSSIHPYL